jgi:ubiquinone/menaquinone biosynthesis C-methylase UbiE
LANSSNKPVSSADPAPSDVWEAAYVSFETPEDETKKFIRRLKKMGALSWPREADILEVFCGRGNGLRALRSLGFSHLLGIDLSASLIRRADSSMPLVVSDARRMPFSDRCKDIVIVQGGFHHLPKLPDDLHLVLTEIKRILRADGRLIVVEPWLTPFLSVVHAACRNRLATGISPKLKALAEMIDNEKPAYEQWLAQPQTILTLLGRDFATQHCSFSFGKLFFIGLRRGG